MAWVRKHCQGKTVIFMADTNATVCGEIDDQVGSICSTKENAASKDFANFLEGTGLWLPTTYGDYSLICQPTSFAKADAELCSSGKRIDFVGVDKFTAALPGSATTWPDFVMPHAIVDHHPAAVRIMPKVKAKDGFFRR